MSEPTSALKAYDLVLDVALAAGVAYYGSTGQTEALIPLNKHDLEKCLRCVNRGIQMFIASAPIEGWRWTNRIMKITLGTVQTEGTVDSGSSTTLIDSVLKTVYTADNQIKSYYIYDQTKEIYAVITGYAKTTGTITVTAWLDYDDEVSASIPASGDNYSITNVQTVDGDKTRYPLSQDFQGEVSGRITYAADSGRGHIIDWCHETTIRIKQEVTVTTGYPTRVATRPWRKRRWELIVDPSPTAGDTLIFPYRIGFNEIQMITGDSSITADPTKTLVDSSLANLYPNDYFNRWYIYCIDGTGKNSYAKVSGYTGNNGTFTIADWLNISGGAGGTDPAAGGGTMYYAEPANNRHPAGQQFDTVVRAACLAMTEREFDDLAGKNYMGEFLEFALPKAYEIDRRSAPKKLGLMLSGTKPFYHKRNWQDVECVGEK